MSIVPLSPVASASAPLKPSTDGYLRMTCAEFSALHLVHLLTDLYADSPQGPPPDGQRTSIVGYTEWVTTGHAAVSVGWDWQLGAAAGRARCLRISEPLSNVMLVDSGHRDLGPERTAALLGPAIDCRPWHDTALHALHHAYSGGYLSILTVT